MSLVLGIHLGYCTGTSVIDCETNKILYGGKIGIKMVKDIKDRCIELSKNLITIFKEHYER